MGEILLIAGLIAFVLFFGGVALLLYIAFKDGTDAY